MHLAWEHSENRMRVSVSFPTHVRGQLGVAGEFKPQATRVPDRVTGYWLWRCLIESVKRQSAPQLSR